MRLIVDLFYVFIWFLSLIGDGVLFALGFIIIRIKRFTKHFPAANAFFLTSKRSHKLKKKQTLFKHKKQNKKLLLINTEDVTRHLIHGLFVLGIHGFILGFVVFYAGKISVIASIKFITREIKLAINIFALPFILLYRFDKTNRKAFIREQAKIEALKLEKKLRRGRPSFWYRVKIFFWGFTFAGIFIFIPLAGLVFLSDLPNPSSISTAYIPKTTKIYDRHGNLLYEIFANQNRTVVPLKDVPVKLQQATIAIEDRDFYTHPGFDVRGIARAFVSNLQNRELQGGSTITQQLIKSSLLTPEPTVTRKVKEVILAFWAERIYNKSQILELYFNYVPYGGTAWGVQAASEVYFGKPVEKLNLSESAFLAGIPRAPSIYSPYSGSGDLWKKRQNDVLSAMVKQGYITKKEAQKAYNEKLNFKGPNVAIKAPHFVMYVKDLLVQKYGLSEVERGGLQVKTTLDLSTQNLAQETVKNEVANSYYLNISNGASVVLDPRNGDVLAMVGSKDYFDMEHDGNVNLVTSLRQPGSTIKIVTYSLALSSGFTQATLIDDSPLTITPIQGPSYTPVNYDGSYHGRLPLRLAFANSLNIPAVRVAQKVGVENIIEQGKRMGITTWDESGNYGLSITLGGAETTMLNLATVYGTVANSGKRVDPDPILEIKDSQGETIYKKEPTESQVLDPGVAFIVSDILSDNKARSMEFGPNSPLNIPNHKVSVKTGTTDNKRDNWTVGFTPNVVVATWVGNNDNSPMSQNLASGITGAAPMWNKIITKMLEKENEGPLLIPDSVVKRSCYGYDMYFLRGTEISSCRNTPLTPSPTSPATALAQ